MQLPNFYILGGQKCGTHWISENIGQHPEVYIKNKEIHYYDNDTNYSKGSEWYGRHFNSAKKHKAVGESTPNYLTDVNTPKRIKENTPEARFIISLRNPVDRAVSALLHHIRSGRYSPWININDELSRIVLDFNDPYGIIKFGRYGEHIERFANAFPIDRFLFIIFERDILVEGYQTLSKMCGFLNVDVNFQFKNTSSAKNVGAKSRFGLVLSRIRFMNKYVGTHFALLIERIMKLRRIRLASDTRKELYEYYLPEIMKCEKIINSKLEMWYEVDDM